MTEPVKDIAERLDAEIAMEDLDPREHYQKHGLDYAFVDAWERTILGLFLEFHKVPSTEYHFEQDGTGYILNLRMPQ